MTTLTVPARFNGPVRSGNGGFTAGAFAELVPGSDHAFVEVTLRRPPPLDTEMQVTSYDGRSVLAEGDDVVAEARVVDLDLVPVDPVPPDVAADAMLRYPGLVNHPFPTCFACGPDRDEGDGLRIFPGPISTDPADRGHVASLWLPTEHHAETTVLDDAQQRCGIATTWAALDCVGGWSEDLEGRPCVLGRMTARVDALPVVGEPHVVVGRHLRTDGRKSFTSSTLYDADRRVVASATHVWIQVDPNVFN
jgi:hypothetical protein